MSAQCQHNVRTTSHEGYMHRIRKSFIVFFLHALTTSGSKRNKKVESGSFYDKDCGRQLTPSPPSYHFYVDVAPFFPLDHQTCIMIQNICCIQIFGTCWTAFERHERNKDEDGKYSQFAAEAENKVVFTRDHLKTRNSRQIDEL